LQLVSADVGYGRVRWGIGPHECAVALIARQAQLVTACVDGEAAFEQSVGRSEPAVKPKAANQRVRRGVLFAKVVAAVPSAASRLQAGVVRNAEERTECVDRRGAS